MVYLRRYLRTLIISIFLRINYYHWLEEPRKAKIILVFQKQYMEIFLHIYSKSILLFDIIKNFHTHSIHISPWTNNALYITYKTHTFTTHSIHPQNSFVSFYSNSQVVQYSYITHIWILPPNTPFIQLQAFLSILLYKKISGDNAIKSPYCTVTPYKLLGQWSDILNLKRRNNQLERRARPPPRNVPLDA